MPKRTQQSIRAYRTGVLLAILFIFALTALYIGIPNLGTMRYQGAALPFATATPELFVRKATHVPTPAFVRGIYMTSCVAATPRLRENLVKLVDETELNTIIIDIKSFDGYISFVPEAQELQAAAGGCLVRDMQDFIDGLHERGIYVAGRVAAFQDSLQVKLHPELAVKRASATSTVWADHKGIPWIDASARPHWEYLAAIAREAHAIGFDEINFDYIRFPSDGNMKDIWYPWSGTRKKSDIMRSFYEYIRDELSGEGIVISADLFGMTTTNEDDLNIGQILEHALASFDYVAPMVYPSHYPFNFMNLGDPNQRVYDVVKISMGKAAARAVATTTSIEMPGARIGTTSPAVYAKPSFDRKKLRPWLQDNNYPVPYTADMVRAQIQAAYDVGLDSWMLWNAGNRYTRAALEGEPSLAN